MGERAIAGVDIIDIKHPVSYKRISRFLISTPPPPKPSLTSRRGAGAGSGPARAKSFSHYTIPTYNSCRLDKSLGTYKQTVTSTRVSGVLKLSTDALPTNSPDARHVLSDTSKIKDRTFKASTPPLCESEGC
ncbi:hypothetical protein EVAR_18345_1 [Eumeta japonica]|uniref:Uncharacterized protein n=1 Tax=Eumeta variegata TaxID=151549 RepID=A0A4C1V9J5_EUMVA|nr:hypothetical protein EVAR_18345_1 [Eumeta japonica]